MKTSQKQSYLGGGWLGVLLLAALAFSGCAEQPTMILIRGQAVMDSSCALPSDPTEFLSEGILDVSLASSYLMTPNLENVAANSASVGAASTGSAAKDSVWSNLGVEGNRVLITEVEVDYQFINAVPDIAYAVFQGFELPLGGAVIEPSGGRASMPVTVINLEQINTLKAFVQPDQTLNLVVKLKFYGLTSSDSEVESNTFKFPIRVCNGCLVTDNCDAEGSLAEGRCILPGQDVPFCPEQTITDEDLVDPVID